MFEDFGFIEDAEGTEYYFNASNLTHVNNFSKLSVGNHVRFIDDHCVDSEEIRSEMQRDIDRLVNQLEDQEKSTRTSQSLQSQVQRLEGK